MRIHTALFSALLACVPTSAYARVSILVSLADQTMDVAIVSDMPASTLIKKISVSGTVAIPSNETYHWNVSTGRPGHSTPTGTYGTTRLAKHYYSKKYHARMPNSIFFIETEGIAIHAATSGEIAHLGHRVSHGCVRLAPENAQLLYERVEREGLKNTIVVIR